MSAIFSPQTILQAFAAMCMAESGDDPTKINEEEGAWGVAQIRQVMVDECNRIIALDGDITPLLRPFEHSDAFEVKDSFMMFCIHSWHHGREYKEDICREPTIETIVRMWNGGPDGWNESSTLHHWGKVKKFLPDWCLDGHELEARRAGDEQ